MKLGIPNIVPDDWNSVRIAIQKIASQLGTDRNVTFGDLALTNLTASRLAQTDTNKALSSVSDLTSWIAGTANQVNVADDGDGTTTLSLPQDVDTQTDFIAGSLTVKDESENVIFYVDNDELYFAGLDGGVGSPIGLLLTLTYAA